MNKLLQILIIKILSYLQWLKPINLLIKRINLKWSTHTVDVDNELNLYNLSYLKTSKILLWLKTLTIKTILILIFTILLIIYYYIIYKIHMRTYEMYLIDLLIRVKIDLLDLFIKDWYNSTNGSLDTSILNSITPNLHEINGLSIDTVINMEWMFNKQNIQMFYELHNIQNYRDLLILNPTNHDLIIFNNLITTNIELKLKFQTMMVQEIVTTHLENLIKLNAQSFRMFIITSPVILLIFTLLYLETLLVLV